MKTPPVEGVGRPSPRYVGGGGRGDPEGSRREGPETLLGSIFLFRNVQGSSRETVFNTGSKGFQL